MTLDSQTRRRKIQEKEKRRRKELHITTLSDSLLTTASYTLSREREIARFTVESKKAATSGEKRKKKRKKRKEKRRRKKKISKWRTSVRTPGRKLAVPVFTILNSGESVAGWLCVSPARDAFSLQRKPRCTRCRVTFNWVICPGTPSIRAVIGLI